MHLSPWGLVCSECLTQINVSGWPCLDVGQQQPQKWTQLLLTLSKRYSQRSRSQRCISHWQRQTTQLRDEAQRCSECTTFRRLIISWAVWGKREKGQGQPWGKRDHRTQSWYKKIWSLSQISRLSELERNLNARSSQCLYVTEKWWPRGQVALSQSQNWWGSWKSCWGDLPGVAPCPPNHQPSIPETVQDEPLPQVHWLICFPLTRLPFLRFSCTVSCAVMQYSFHCLVYSVAHGALSTISSHDIKFQWILWSSC